MPNIPQFDAGNLSIRPSETGVEAVASTARRIGMFFNQTSSAEETLARETERLAGQTQQLGRETAEVGKEQGAALANVGRTVGSSIAAAGDVAVKYLDNQQISKGAADFTAMMLQKTKDWNDAVKNADPNDPTVGPKFLAQLNGDLDKFKNGGEFFTENGQKWAEAHVDAMRQHFAEKTIADMSTLAGEAAVVNHQQTINQLSATVHSDPTSIDTALATLRSTTEGVIATNPNLSGAKAAEVRGELLQKGSESIVKAAAIGYIEKTAKMPSWVSDPKYAPYVNGPELQMLERAAKTQARSDLATQKQIELYNRQIADQNAHAAANKAFTDNVTIDPVTNRPVMGRNFFSDALAVAKNNPNAPSGGSLARTLFEWGEHQQNQKGAPVTTDVAAASALDSRMFTADNPTTKMDILRAEADKKLSSADATLRIKMIDERDRMPTDPQFKLAMDGAKELIEGRTSGEKSLQAGKYATFMQQFLSEYQRQKAAGTLPPNALSLRDPNSLISKSMEAYKSPLASAVGGNGGITPPPPAAAAAAAPAPKGPEIGDLRQGNGGQMFRFKGGDWRKKENWEPAG